MYCYCYEYHHKDHRAVIWKRYMLLWLFPVWIVLDWKDLMAESTAQQWADERIAREAAPDRISRSYYNRSGYRDEGGL